MVRSIRVVVTVFQIENAFDERHLLDIDDDGGLKRCNKDNRK